MAQAHEQRSARRQCEEHAGKAEQLAEREQREDHRERVQPDAIAHQPGNQDVTFQELADAVDREHGDEPRPAGELQQRRDHAQHQPETEADIGNEHQQARQDADRHRKLQAGQRQSDRVVHREREHDPKLATDEFGEDVVDLDGDRARLGEPASRQAARRCGAE